MPPLPNGTITFLFTDIEGSTPLWESQPDAMWTTIQRHHAIMRSAVEEHDGQVFNIAGDAFCVAFATAGDALAAALAAQRTLHAEIWGATPIRVRMGLHTGSAVVDGKDYHTGPTLNRVARVMGLAAGGQILLSQSTAELVRRQLPEAVALRDLGEHRLKGLPEPERILQIVAPDLPDAFPPLKTSGVTPNNLPLQLTSFIGREHEMSEVKHWLATARLVTLTGSGGAGKTRLSLQVARDLLDDFADGVWLVEFAPLVDPSFVPHTVAAALKIPEQPGRPPVDTLTDFLRDKQLLLILDNCEHLVEACARLADALLHAAPRLTILASSREALNIAGEVAWRVPSLEMPGVQPSAVSGQPSAISHSPSVIRQPQTDMLAYPAIRLFVERATHANASFKLTPGNAPIVAQICQRLDGMPLAIELAAARIKALPVEQIAARLDDRFKLLTTGSRTAVPRQQTLRAAIDWSYELLSEPERVLLGRLSVFAGGWTLEAAELVCADEVGDDSSSQGGRVQDPSLPQEDVLDVMTRLVEKSLVVAEQGGETRYRMLETIRQFAWGKLAESGEIASVQTQHLKFFAKLSEGFDHKFVGPQSIWWLDKFDTELDNVRTAIEWSKKSRDSLTGMRLAGGLQEFWFQRHPDEGLAHVSSLLALPELSRQSKDYAIALRCQGYLQSYQGNVAQGLINLQEALAIIRHFDDEFQIGYTLLLVGQIAQFVNEQTLAHASLAEALVIFRRIDTMGHARWAMWLLADEVFYEGDIEQAKALYEEIISTENSPGTPLGVAIWSRRLGQVAVRQGDPVRGGPFIRESLSINAEAGDLRGVAACVTALAGASIALGRPMDAVRLLGFADKILESMHTELSWFDREQFTVISAILRSQLDSKTFDSTWDAGRAMEIEQGIAEAMRSPARDAQVVDSAHGPDDLSTREREVLSLVAAGLSDAQVAEKLILSPRTINSHLTTIYRKLGVNSRAAATRYALDHKLV